MNQRARVAKNDYAIKVTVLSISTEANLYLTLFDFNVKVEKKDVERKGRGVAHLLRDGIMLQKLELSFLFLLLRRLPPQPAIELILPIISWQWC